MKDPTFWCFCFGDCGDCSISLDEVRGADYEGAGDRGFRAA